MSSYFFLEKNKRLAYMFFQQLLDEGFNSFVELTVIEEYD